MLADFFSFLTKKITSPKAKKFFEKLGIYGFVRKIYRSFLLVWGRKGLPLKIEGVNAKLIVSNPNELNLYYSLDNEGEFIGEVLKRVNENTVFYDVGAHVGLYSLSVGRCKIPPRFIYCWEPEPLNYKRLNENLKINKIENARTFQAALGAEDAILKLYTGAREPGSLTPNLTRESQIFKEVKAWRGDNCVLKEGLFPPTIIKIDVEGYELNVLKGLKETIRKARTVIFLEVHPEFLKNLGFKKEDVFALLAGLDYRNVYSALRRDQEHCIFEPK